MRYNKWQEGRNSDKTVYYNKKQSLRLRILLFISVITVDNYTPMVCSLITKEVQIGQKKETKLMKKKLLIYLLSAMVLSTTAMVSKSMTMSVYAYTQDEYGAYHKYINSLIEQGYTKGDIAKILNKNPNGSLTSAITELEQAITDGTLKKSGSASSAASETPSTTTAPSTETKEEKPAHKHEYTANLTTNPTCTEEGVMTYTCSCGDSYTESYPKLEHQYEKEVTREATCSKEGEWTYTCSLCGDSYTEEIPKTEHTAGAAQVTKAATCTEEGEQTISCTVCGELIRTEAIPATGHTEGEPEVTRKADWFHAGLLETQCVDCGAVLSSEEIPQTFGAVQITALAAALVVMIGAVIFVVAKKKKK